MSRPKPITTMGRMDIVERMQLLRNNNDGIEEGSYDHELTEEEIYERQLRLQDSIISLRDLREEKKEVNKGYKDKMDPLQVIIDTTATELKTGLVEMSGIQYKVIDHEIGLVEFYDELGALVSSRKIFPAEKQTNLFRMPNKGTGTNG